MLLASAELDTAVRCIELGAEGYLPKPIDSALLRAGIGACLDRNRLHDQEQRHRTPVERKTTEMSEWNRTLEQRVQDWLVRLEQADRLMQLLPGQVAAQIISTGDESLLESHRRHSAVLFCDLRGFTAFSETAESEEGMSILRGYHDVVGGPIADLSGTVEHFADDGLTIFFSDPIPCAETALRAVRLALWPK